MVAEIIIVTDDDVELERVCVKHEPMRFLIYRGRLLERKLTTIGKHRYVERSYLELY